MEMLNRNSSTGLGSRLYDQSVFEERTKLLYESCQPSGPLLIFEFHTILYHVLIWLAIGTSNFCHYAGSSYAIVDSTMHIYSCHIYAIDGIFKPRKK